MKKFRGGKYERNTLLSPIIIILALIIVPISLEYVDEQEIELTVNDKYVKGQEGTYFVIDNNDNAYVIQDLFFKGKFNSTDIYNKLKIGNTYKVKISGIRNRLLSRYRNINEILEEGDKDVK